MTLGNLINNLFLVLVLVLVFFKEITFYLSLV
jgi:hypothetical protein